jgi:hypothetical protein
VKAVVREAAVEGTARAGTADVMAPERILLGLLPAGGRVAVVGAPEQVVRALREAGCELLATQQFPSDDALERFAPAKVVLFDAGELGPSLPGAVHAVARVAPGAELLIAFWNASAASRLVEGLASRRFRGPSAPDAAVRAALEDGGFTVAARQPWRADEASGLAAAAERSLRTLFAQLNPSAPDDWVVYTGRRTVVGPAPRSALTPGLLSVVIRNHTLERMELLDQTLFSLACQSYRPLEIVLVTQSRDAVAVATLTAALERHRGVGGYAFQVVSHPSAVDVRGHLLNLGVHAARGQYIAFLDDDDVVYPGHYRRLVDALRRGTAAWSVSQTRTAHFTADADGGLYCRRKSLLSHHERFSLSELVHENYIPSHAYVLDRERVGAFPIAFSEEVNRCEDYIFLLRLAALFRPVFLAGGPSCEYRMRDDGSNSNMMAEQPADVMARERVAWEAARDVKNAVKRSQQMLLTMGEYEDDVTAAFDRGLAAGLHEGRLQGLPPPLRHRIADGINSAVKGALPPAHRALKAVAALLARVR